MILGCKQILELLITTVDIIIVLSCNHLLSESKSNCSAFFFKQDSSVSVTVASDKLIDNCDNVAGANKIFQKMSAE